MFNATFAMLLLTFMTFILDNVPEYQNVIAKISETLTETALANILIYAIGVAIVFVLFWFAVRKVAGIVWRAFKRGKLRL